MRCSKAYHLCDLELVDLFDNEVIEQIECIVSNAAAFSQRHEMRYHIYIAHPPSVS